MHDCCKQGTFTNEPPLDFTISDNRTAFQKALDTVAQKISNGDYTAVPIIDGKKKNNSNQLESINPSDGTTVVGPVTLASREDALEALKSLKEGQQAWAMTPVQERADIIRKAAQIMREQRNELSALIVYEAGKPWKEADGDVIEAIDFCDYYAEEMLRLGKYHQLMEVAGEQNIYTYAARGIGVVISPWNFPLAIACGMTTASLVTGNATILKPAEQTSIIAAQFADILYQAGIPDNAFAFLPGIGEEIGPVLVDHPDVDLICFTGSKAVGLEIIQKAAICHPGQRNVKKVIAEMGGKNAIVIDEDADLDEAIHGALYSAFGFAGQKCSACSRVICVGDCYEPFLARLQQAAGDIAVGAADQPATYLGPVIDQETQARLLRQIEEAAKEMTPLFQGTVPDKGYFVPATVFRDVPADAAIWQQELFGPVLACTQVADFESGVARALDSEYALTGGVFSRSPNNIQYAYQHFKVGNLYINRPITGAIVLRQPFGGSKMSGVGSKAGGPDYLLQFLEPRTITENTMRRGFTPELL